MFKRLSIAVVLLTFTAPAFAGNYCVYFPSTWTNSPFTKTDNDIRGTFQWQTDFIYLNNQNNVHKVVQKYPGKVFLEPGDQYRYRKWRSEYHASEKVEGRYFKWCHNMRRIVHKTNVKNNNNPAWREGYRVLYDIKGFRVEIKNGDDCPWVRNNGFIKNHNFRIYRKLSGGLAWQPWGCVKK